MRLCDILEGEKRTSFGGGLTSTSRCCLGILLLNGNPQKVPRMVPTRDWAPPSFPTHPSMTGNHHQPHSGTGTGEPQQRLRVDASFHQLRSPVWEGHGVFSRSGQQSTRGNSRNRNRVDRGSAGRRFRAGKTGTSHNMGQSPASLRSPSAAARSRCRSG
jgi:hypothetical protein